MNPRYFLLTMSVTDTLCLRHAAELVERDTESCAILRLVELDAAGQPSGWFHHTAGSQGLTAEPNPVIPHVDAWTEFPDVSATEISRDEFERLWVRW